MLLFLDYIFTLLKKWNVTKKIVDWFEKKVLSKREQIDKYGYFGLMLFVGIPLPGTGAWTGSALAVLLGLDKKKSFLFIVLGVLLAAVIMSIVSELLVMFFSALVLVYGGASITKLTATQITASLGVNMSYIYMILPICGVIIVIYSLLNIAEYIGKLKES